MSHGSRWPRGRLPISCQIGEVSYALENRDLNGTPAAELFARQTEDPRIQALLQAIHQQIPTKAIIFDVSTTAVVNDANQTLTDIVYRVLLRELGYASDPEIAELEILLEAEGRLAEFVERHSELYAGAKWDEVKHYTANARNRASRVLHELDPATFPQADSWAKTLAAGDRVKVRVVSVDAGRGRIGLSMRGG